MLDFQVENSIHLERQSVCMGDDATAPNARDLSFSPDMLLSELLNVIAESIPIRFNGQHTIWGVENDKRPVALLETDVEGHYSYELLIEDMLLRDMERRDVYCRYFYDYKGNLCSHLSQYVDGSWKDIHPECMTLSDKVKAFYGLIE